MKETQKYPPLGGGAARADHGLEPGHRFEGRYEILGRIGTGGFSHVYHARQPDIGRDVAIKLLLPEPTRAPGAPLYDPRVVERFEREGRLLSRLRDPHTITMYDFGRSAAGLLYMVFEFIDGTSLKDVILHQAPLPPGRVVQILSQVLQSLQEAHAIGVLHRDIKPTNIMVYDHIGRTNQIKVLDFGIAKAVRGGDGGLTQVDLTTDGAVVGTPRYMSPEQLRGNDLTPATDLYSLGLVTYELLTGERAMRTRGTMQVLSEQLNGASVRLPADLPVPAVLRRVVDQLMEKDRARRQISADQVLAQLRELIAVEVQLATAPAARSPSVPTVALLEDPTGDSLSAEFVAATEGNLAMTTDVLRDEDEDEDEDDGADDDPTWRTGPVEPSTAPELDAPPITTTTAPEPAAARWRWWHAGVPVVVLAGGLVTFFGEPLDEATPRRDPAAVEDAPRAATAATRHVLVRTVPEGLLVRVDGVSYGPAPARVEHVEGQTLHVEVLRGGDTLHAVSTDSPSDELVLRVPREAAGAGEEAPEEAVEGAAVEEAAREAEVQTGTGVEREEAPPRERPRAPRKRRPPMFEPMDEPTDE